MGLRVPPVRKQSQSTVLTVGVLCLQTQFWPWFAAVFRAGPFWVPAATDIGRSPVCCPRDLLWGHAIGGPASARRGHHRYMWLFSLHFGTRGRLHFGWILAECILDFPAYQHPSVQQPLPPMGAAALCSRRDAGQGGGTGGSTESWISISEAGPSHGTHSTSLPGKMVLNSWNSVKQIFFFSKYLLWHSNGYLF